MKKHLLLIAATCMGMTGFAQSFKLNSQEGVSTQANWVSLNSKIQFNPGAAKTFFSLNTQSDLVFEKKQSDKLGFIHYRYYQTYNGVPVEKSMFIVHTKNGFFRGANGTVVTIFNDEALSKSSASLSPQKAVSIAIAQVNAKEYAWQDKSMESRLKTQFKNPNATFYPKAELVYYNPEPTLKARELKLCYKVDVYALQPLSRADYFIDAKSGKVIGKNDKIFFSDAVGTANTAYSGTQTIHSDQTGANAYRLRDYTKGDGVITVHGESGKRGQDYTSTSNNWNLTGFDQAAMDAHYGVGETYNYYMAKFDRNSYDDQGTALYSYVNDPTYLDNAFWDGSAMNFNKRSNGNPGGVTGIDVTGHELTHGVTQETCGLNYAYEPGAMNESLSDIMGKSVQFYAKPNDINWLLSNDMGWIIRDMSNPNALGQPDTYKGLYWYTGGGDNGGVHYNSGVGNFMFYLLVNGGTGTNDNGDNYTVSGIGLDDADQIIYRTQTVYLTPISQYDDWRAACISASTDLYGATSTQTNNVKNAWYAVGVGTDSSGCDKPSGLTATNIKKKSATLQWSAAGVSIGYNLQWKLVTATNWTTVSNISSTSYTLNNLIPGFSYQFRVQTQCSSNTNSSYSDAYTFTTESLGNVYCTSYGSSQSFEYIQSVGLKERTYVSGNNGGYGNFISAGGILKVNRQDELKLTPGFTGSAYDEYWTVYIDYNHDGDFKDAGEMIGTVHGTGAVSLPFVVPSNATPGVTRLRVQMTYGSAETDPCAVMSYGETEDYSVRIFADNNSIVADGNTSSLTVSPNPVKGYTATAILNLSKQGNTNIRITDLSGRTFATQQLKNGHIGKNTIPLSGLNNLTNGVYLVVAEQNGIVIGRSQLIIDK